MRGKWEKGKEEKKRKRGGGSVIIIMQRCQRFNIISERSPSFFKERLKENLSFSSFMERNISFTRLLWDGGLRAFPIDEYESAGQQGGKGKHSLHGFRRKKLQWGTKQSQERFRRDSSLISRTKSFKDFRPECGKPGTKPGHMGMVGCRCFAPESVTLR